MRLQDSFALKAQGVISIVGAGGKSSLMYALAHDLVQSGKRVLTTTTTKMYKPGKKESPAVMVSRNPEEIVARATALLQEYPHLSLGGEELRGQGKLLGVKPEIIECLQASKIFDFLLVEADGAASRSLKASGPGEPVIPAVSDCIITVVGLDVVEKKLEDRMVHRASIYSELTGLALGQKVTPFSIAIMLQHEMEKQAAARKDARRIIFLNKAETKQILAAGKEIIGFLEKRVRPTPNRIVIGELRPWPCVHQCRIVK